MKPLTLSFLVVLLLSFQFAAAQPDPQFEFAWSRDIGPLPLWFNTDKSYTLTSDSSIVYLTISDGSGNRPLYFNKTNLNGQPVITNKLLPFTTNVEYYYHLFPTAGGGTLVVKYIRLGPYVHLYLLDRNGNLISSKDVSQTTGYCGFKIAQRDPNGNVYVIFNRYDNRYLNVVGSRVLVISPAGTQTMADLHNISFDYIFPQSDNTVLTIEKVGGYQQYFVRRSLQDGSILKMAEVPFGVESSGPRILGNIIYDDITHRFHYLVQDTAAPQPGTTNFNALTIDSGFNLVRTTNFSNFKASGILVLTADKKGGWYLSQNPRFANDFALARIDSTDQVTWAYWSEDQYLAKNFQTIIPLQDEEFIAGLFDKFLRVKVSVPELPLFVKGSGFEKLQEGQKRNWKSSNLEVIYNNPSYFYFRLNIRTALAEKILVQVTDVSGHVVEQKVIIPAQINTIELGEKFTRGIYFVKISQGRESKTLKLVRL